MGAANLRVLVAEDQAAEVSEACEALRAEGHDVITAFTYEAAERLVGEDMFDVAILDLGWYTDEQYVSRHGSESAANAGWKLDGILTQRSPDAVRILYTTRTRDRDGESIVAEAARRGMLLVKKYESGSQQHLASVATFVAQRVGEARQAQATLDTSSALWRALVAVSGALALVLIAAVLIWTATGNVATTALLLSLGAAAALGFSALILTATRDLRSDEARPFLEIMRDVLKPSRD
jgi:CheY-like chemotaxis protein